uniref:DUF4378 domain-containing protein n=1 Tax=Leersia perrieri TaxID=77586 RepID=A0A0D9XT42_9ORYZ
MASLSPSPSPSGRRLSELLEEKQEPFFLDLHLLEKGCSSSRLLDTALCWPSAAGGGSDAAASVLRRLTSRNKTKKNQPPPSPAPAKKTGTTPAASGLLRMILSKILHGKSAAVSRKPAALQSSESFKKIPVAVAAVDVAGIGEEEEIEYTDSESEDEKQFSPVSVLDKHNHPFDCSPAATAAAASPTKDAMAFIRDLLLLEAAYSPALLTHLLSKSDELIKMNSTDIIDDDNGDDDCCYNRRTTSPKNDDEVAAAAAYWETNKAELTRVSELVAGEVRGSSRLDAGEERDGVGGEIADAVLEEILLELAVELAGGC